MLRFPVTRDSSGQTTILKAYLADNALIEQLWRHVRDCT